MIVLKIPSEATKSLPIIDRLKSLSLAFRKEENAAVKEITLEDGQSIVEGTEKIEQYLDQLQGELHQWYYCSC